MPSERTILYLYKQWLCPSLKHLGPPSLLYNAYRVFPWECGLSLKLTSHIHLVPCLNPLNAELNPICPLLALFGAHHILHVSRVRVKMSGTMPLIPLYQCFSTAGPRPGTGPWHQLYRAARGSPGICHFSFLSNFHE